MNKTIIILIYIKQKFKKTIMNETLKDFLTLLTICLVSASITLLGLYGGVIQTPHIKNYIDMGYNPLTD